MKTEQLDKYIELVKLQIEIYLNEKNNQNETNVIQNKQSNRLNDNMFGFITMDDVGAYFKKNKKEVESFPNMLNRLIGENGDSMTTISKRIGLDGTTLSKYANNTRPINKKDLLRILIGVECNTRDAVDFMETSGFPYNKTSDLDLVIMAHIESRDFDTMKINQHLQIKNVEKLFKED